MTADAAETLPLHVLVLLAAPPPPDLADRGEAHRTTTVDLAVDTAAALLAAGEEGAARITLVVPGWSDLRLAEMPARLLGSAPDVLIRLTDETSRSLRPTGVGPLAMKGASVEFSGSADGALTVRVRRTKPMKLAEVVRGLLGPHVGLPLTPLRAALRSRTIEAYVVGNPFARYAGIDDAITSVHQHLSMVDVILEDAALDDGGELYVSAPGADRPVVRVGVAASGGDRQGGVVADLRLPPVDTVVINPIGFDAAPQRRTGRITAGDSSGTMLRLVDGGDGEVFTVRPGAPLSRRQVQATRRLSYAALDTQAPLDAFCCARLLSQLAATGLPLVARPLEPSVQELLGSELSHQIERVTPDALADPLQREAASIRLRRAALRTHSPAARARRIAETAGVTVPPPPTVSVLLVTRRPIFLRSALDQIARQTWEQLEVVLGLHGDEFDASELDDCTAAFPRPITTVRVGGDRSFGDALNAATAAASGAYVTKWDDDDFYGTHHVEDLVAAADYSGAALVGKGGDIVVLDSLGVTVRGPNPVSERRVKFVAGGTLFLRRDTLQDVGGWRPLPYSVDRALLRQITDAGGLIYRTHQIGYLLRRHGHGHTWDPGIDYFLDNATDQWPSDSPRQALVLEADANA